MSQKFENIKLDLDEDIKERVERLVPGHSDYRILRESVDARRGYKISKVLSLEIFGPHEKSPQQSFDLDRINYKGAKPLIVGAGPAGLFAALRLVERGIPCVLIERGSEAPKRLLAINRFWRYGELNPEDNVCYGEGGAGLYSDGKLMTRIKSEHIPYIMRRLVEFGAPAEIEYLANPHVGSDRIRRVIPILRKKIIDLGGEIHFNTKLTEIIFEGQRVVGAQTQNGKTFATDHLILATGHSAKDIFSLLQNSDVKIEGKSFALGLRVEHPQKLINKIQYREQAEHPALGSANYKLTHHHYQDGVGVYSFCMCPGGYVLSSGTDEDGVVCNGMSNYHRNSPFANSGIVMSIDFQKWFQKPFEGLEFQHQLERVAKQQVLKAGGTKEIPAQKLTDFLKNKKGEVLKSSSPSGVVPVNFLEILPPQITEKLREGFEQFERKLKGFIGDYALLHGLESRTSSPLRVPRNPETLESVSHQGLYPVGEGAGYAGGITSAACDGIRAAEKILEQVNSQKTAIISSQS